MFVPVLAMCGEVSLCIAPRLQRRRSPVRGHVVVASPPADLEGHARSQPVQVRGQPELYHPAQGNFERRWAGVDMAMQRIWALHSRVYSRCNFTCAARD